MKRWTTIQKCLPPVALILFALGCLFFLRFGLFSEAERSADRLLQDDAWSKVRGKGLLDLESVLAEIPPELFTSEGLLPKSHRYPRELMRALIALEDHCLTSPEVPAVDAAVEKAFALAALKCDPNLPVKRDAFIEALARPPYIHPLGGSFTLRFAQGVFDEVPESLLNTLHVTERKNAAPRQDPADWLAQLEDLDTLDDLIAGERFAADANLFFRRLPHLQRGRVFEVFGLSDVEKSFSQAGFAWDHRFRLANRECALVSGSSGCFVRIPESETQDSVVFFMALVAFISGSYWGGRTIVGLRRERKRAQTEREIILYTISHEYRTPLARASFALETIRSEFDCLSSEAQSSFLELCRSVSEMRRTTERCRQFLNALELGEKPESLEAVRSLLERLPPEVRVTCPPAAEGLVLPAPWPGLILSNLINNALEHGRGEVSLQVLLKGASLTFEVSDEGELPQVLSMNATVSMNMTAAGLGLRIVGVAARRLGTDVKISTDPTRFTLEAYARNARPNDD